MTEVIVLWYIDLWNKKFKLFVIFVQLDSVNNTLCIDCKTENVTLQKFAEISVISSSALIVHLGEKAICGPKVVPVTEFRMQNIVTTTGEMNTETKFLNHKPKGNIGSLCLSWYALLGVMDISFPLDDRIVVIIQKFCNWIVVWLKLVTFCGVSSPLLGSKHQETTIHNKAVIQM
jgi:hypothetical protein